MAEYGQQKQMQVTFTDSDGLELFELLNYYRLMSRMTWTKFILTAFMHYISLDNEMIAQAIKMYMDKRENSMVAGRPKGIGHSQKWKKEQSERMKKRWIQRKAHEQLIKENSNEETTAN